MAEKKINGRTFKVEPMLATQATILQARLVKAIGPGLELLPAIFAGMGSNDDGEKSRSDLAAISAITAVFKQMEPEEYGQLVKDLVEVAMIKRPSGVYEQVDYDGDFTGHLPDVIKVVGFVLREQFGDFFKDALASGNLAVIKGGL